MKDYKELIAKLRATKSQSKRKLLDDAADAIEHLQRQLAHKEDVLQQQAKTIMELRRERDEAAEQAEKNLLLMERMTLGDAYAIFANIDTVELADEVKGLAVWRIARMETHNGVTKDMMVKVIRWLVGLCFEVTEEG